MSCQIPNASRPERPDFWAAGHSSPVWTRSAHPSRGAAAGAPVRRRVAALRGARAPVAV